MANVKISELTASGTLTGTEQVEVVQSGNTRRTTTQAIANLGAGGGSTDWADLLTGASDWAAVLT